jgi:phage replication initiation protein
MTFQNPSFTEVSLVMRDGQVVHQMLRSPAQSECCVIDTLRLTFHERTIHGLNGGIVLDDDAIAKLVSDFMIEIFGFGLSRPYDKGRDFYQSAWEVGDNFGHFAMGGLRQRESVLISINGQGCLAAKEGWEQRLYDFLTGGDVVNPKLTRVDLAHDDFDASMYTVDDYEKEWEQGGFDRFSNRPEPGLYGAWKSGDPRQKGRTFYAGTKSGSQLFRGYEKGKQLGSPGSSWVRSEVQFSNHDRIIPFDILISPSSYFVAAYPVLARFSPETTPKRTEVIKLQVDAGFEHYFRYARTAYGKFIKVAREVFGDEEALDRLQSNTDELPPRLVVPDYRLCNSNFEPDRAVFDPFGMVLAPPALGHTGDTCAFYDQ